MQETENSIYIIDKREVNKRLWWKLLEINLEQVIEMSFN